MQNAHLRSFGVLVRVELLEHVRALLATLELSRELSEESALADARIISRLGVTFN